VRGRLTIDKGCSVYRGDKGKDGKGLPEGGYSAEIPGRFKKRVREEQPERDGR
jgi:hypothetical protein